MKNYYKYVVETNDGKKFDSFENSLYHYLFTSLKECKSDSKEYVFGMSAETRPLKKLKSIKYYKVEPKSKEVK
jgi:hypothetical protein